MIAATEEADVRLVTALLAQGHTPDVTRNGVTPLFIACSEDNLDIVTILLHHGATQITTNHGWTPLFIASAYGHLEIVKVLLDYDADFTPTKSNATPLHAACWRGHDAVVRYLLDKGVDWSVIDRSGETALVSASASGFLKCVRSLLTFGVKLQTAASGLSPLYVALKNGHDDVCLELLDFGDDPYNVYVSTDLRVSHS